MQLPIVQSLSFVLRAQTSLDTKINKAQLGNLALIITAMILGSGMCLSKIVAASLGSCAVNTLSHCFSYANLDGRVLIKSALRCAIRIFGLLGVPIKIAIDDTMKHHSKFCKTIYGASCDVLFFWKLFLICCHVVLAPGSSVITVNIYKHRCIWPWNCF